MYFSKGKAMQYCIEGRYKKERLRLRSSCLEKQKLSMQQNVGIEMIAMNIAHKKYVKEENKSR